MILSCPKCSADINIFEGGRFQCFRCGKCNHKFRGIHANISTWSYVFKCLLNPFVADFIEDVSMTTCPYCWEFVSIIPKTGEPGYNAPKRCLHCRSKLPVNQARQESQLVLDDDDCAKIEKEMNRLRVKKERNARNLEKSEKALAVALRELEIVEEVMKFKKSGKKMDLEWAVSRLAEFGHTYQDVDQTEDWYEYVEAENYLAVAHHKIALKELSRINLHKLADKLDLIEIKVLGIPVINWLSGRVNIAKALKDPERPLLPIYMPKEDCSSYDHRKNQALLSMT